MNETAECVRVRLRECAHTCTHRGSCNKNAKSQCALYSEMRKINECEGEREGETHTKALYGAVITSQKFCNASSILYLKSCVAILQYHRNPLMEYSVRES